MVWYFWGDSLGEPLRRRCGLRRAIRSITFAPSRWSVASVVPLLSLSRERKLFYCFLQKKIVYLHILIFYKKYS
jgi:hypothetical protein